MKERFHRYFSFDGRLARLPFFARGVVLNIGAAVLSIASVPLFSSDTRLGYWSGLLVVVVALALLALGAVSPCGACTISVYPAITPSGLSRRRRVGRSYRTRRSERLRSACRLPRSICGSRSGPVTARPIASARCRSERPALPVGSLDPD